MVIKYAVLALILLIATGCATTGSHDASSAYPVVKGSTSSIDNDQPIASASIGERVVVEGNAYIVASRYFAASGRQCKQLLDQTTGSVRASCEMKGSWYLREPLAGLTASVPDSALVKVDIPAEVLDVSTQTVEIPAVYATADSASVDAESPLPEAVISEAMLSGPMISDAVVPPVSEPAVSESVVSERLVSEPAVSEPVVSGPVAVQTTVEQVPSRSVAVNANENLWRFAKRVTGDANKWTLIADFNSISNALRVREGQVLHVPEVLIPERLKTAAQ